MVNKNKPFQLLNWCFILNKLLENLDTRMLRGILEPKKSNQTVMKIVM